MKKPLFFISRLFIISTHAAKKQPFCQKYFREVIVGSGTPRPKQNQEKKTTIMKSFKHFIALLLAVTLLLAAGAAFPVSAADADADIIEIGDGTAYKNIGAYISKNDYAGKTFRLVSDITESKPTLTKSCTIDGNGFTIASGDNNTCYIINGATTATAENKVKVEFQNVKFNTVTTKGNFILLYVRQHTDVTLTNCVTDQNACCLFAFNDGGGCHLTINSGVYWAKTTAFRANYYNATEAKKSSVTVNGGFFGLLPTGSRCGEAIQPGLFALSGYTELTVRGGTFYSPLKSPIVCQTQQLSEKDVSEEEIARIHPYVNLAGGTFYVPAGQQELFGRWEKVTRGYATFDISAAAKFLQTAPTAVEKGNLALDFTPADLTFTTATDAKITLNGQTFEGLADGAFDGAADAIELTADSAATAVFARTPLFKNGYRADGLTGDAVVQNFGESAYVQYRTNADGSFDARLILAFTDPDCEIAALTVTNPENGKHETIAVTVSYLAFLAEGRTVTAEDCGGTRMLIVSIGGLTEEHSGKTLHISAALTTGAVSHTSRTYALTPEKPAA